MSPSWFLCSNDVVTGPFTTDQVRAQISGGNVGASCFIWWKGQREWLPLSHWESHLEQILNSSSAKPESKVWYIDLGTNTLGPLTHSEMIENLKSQKSLATVNLWSVGMKNWAKVFELYDVMEEVGLSRRVHERAPLMGSVAITRSNSDPKGYVLKTASVSIAGLGAVGEHDLHRGDEVSVLIKSANLPGSMHLRGEVAYVQANGYVGIRFIKAQPEAQSIILDYVKRFNQEAAQSNAA